MQAPLSARIFLSAEATLDRQSEYRQPYCEIGGSPAFCVKYSLSNTAARRALANVRFLIAVQRGMTDMPILEDPRQERFAQLVAAGATRSDAYRAAGYKGRGAAHGASAVMRREGVRDRIEELQAEQIKDLRQRRANAAEAEQIDDEWILKRGVRLLDAAQDDKHYAVASQTLERIARIYGCWDRSEPEGDQVIRIYSDRPLTEEEWLRMYAPHNLEGPDDNNPAPSN
jgi:hypothetical protein